MIEFRPPCGGAKHVNLENTGKTILSEDEQLALFQILKEALHEELQL